MPLGGVRDGIPDERENVIVGDAVDDALAVSLAVDQPGGVQDLRTPSASTADYVLYAAIAS